MHGLNSHKWIRIMFRIVEELVNWKFLSTHSSSFCSLFELGSSLYRDVTDGRSFVFLCCMSSISFSVHVVERGGAMVLFNPGFFNPHAELKLGYWLWQVSIMDKLWRQVGFDRYMICWWKLTIYRRSQLALDCLYASRLCQQRPSKCNKIDTMHWPVSTVQK